MSILQLNIDKGFIMKKHKILSSTIALFASVILLAVGLWSCDKSTSGDSTAKSTTPGYSIDTADVNITLSTDQTASIKEALGENAYALLWAASDGSSDGTAYLSQEIIDSICQEDGKSAADVQCKIWAVKLDADKGITTYDKVSEVHQRLGKDMPTTETEAVALANPLEAFGIISTSEDYDVTENDAAIVQDYIYSSTESDEHFCSGDIYRYEFVEEMYKQVGILHEAQDQETEEVTDAETADADYYKKLKEAMDPTVAEAASPVIRVVRFVVNQEETTDIASLVESNTAKVGAYIGCTKVLCRSSKYKCGFFNSSKKCRWYRENPGQGSLPWSGGSGAMWPKKCGCSDKNLSGRKVN